VQCGIGRRPTTCRTSSRRFLPKLGPCHCTAHFFASRRQRDDPPHGRLARDKLSQGRLCRSPAEFALHQDAVNPASMLEPNRRQEADAAEPEALVQDNRGSIAVIPDYRHDLAVSGIAAAGNECSQKRAADTASHGARRDIDRILSGEAIGRAQAVGSRVGEVEDGVRSAGGHEVREPRASTSPRRRAISVGGRLFFERCEARQHVVAVDFADRNDGGLGGVTSGDAAALAARPAS
jgi:hypothetical protein